MANELIGSQLNSLIVTRPKICNNNISFPTYANLGGYLATTGSNYGIALRLFTYDVIAGIGGGPDDIALNGPTFRLICSLFYNTVGVPGSFCQIRSALNGLGFLYAQFDTSVAYTTNFDLYNNTYCATNYFRRSNNTIAGKLLLLYGF